MTELKEYQSLESLFDQLANDIGQHLEADLATGDTALVVSGGTTPKPLFERLSVMPLSWDRVTLVPSDERWLATDHMASNENLIRTSLQQQNAAVAKVQGLKLDFQTAKAAEEELNERLSSVLDSYSVAVVGMGLDGHFASIFPGTEAMDKSLIADGSRLCYAVDATGCPVAGEYSERMTLTLPAILNARHVYLLITGQEKLELIKQVLAGNSEVAQLPIVKLLQQNQTAVTVCCA